MASSAKVAEDTSEKLENSKEEEEKLRLYVSKCYFEDRSLIAHQFDSFNDFFNFGLQNLFAESSVIEVAPDHHPGPKRTHHGLAKQARVTFGKVYVKKPEKVKDSIQDEKAAGTSKDKAGTSKDKAAGPSKVQQETCTLYPREARLRNLTYSASIYVDLKSEVYVPSEKNDEILHKEFIEQVFIGKIPVMVKSQFCHLYGMVDKELQQKEDCGYDMGGYFIVKGAEKVIIAQEELYLQRIWVSDRNGWKVTSTGPSKGFSKFRNRTLVKLVELKQKTTGVSKPPILELILPGLKNAIPLFIMFRALGVTTDKELFEKIAYDLSDTQMMELLLPSLPEAELRLIDFFKSVKDDKQESAAWTHSQDKALEFIARNLKSRGNEAPSSEEERLQMIEAAKQAIRFQLLPHIGGGDTRKAFFLGYMVHSLCLCYLGRRQKEDKDNYKNKRLDLVGQLFSLQLRQLMGRFQSELCRRLQKYLARDQMLLHANEYIDPSIITNGFKTAFSTGNWATKGNMAQKNTGVVATLSRTNPMATACHLRLMRLQVQYAAKIGDARYPNFSQYGRICPVDTPDGENCGLVKSMSLTGFVSLESPQDPILEYLSEWGMQNLEEVSSSTLCKSDKIFLNGKWVGVHEEPECLVETLRKLRRSGHILSEVEIARDVIRKEVKIYTDSGRILRPLLIVENQRLLMTKKHIIKAKALKSESAFRSLLQEGVVELLGVEEEEGALVALNVEDLGVQNRRQIIHYTHCELHPSFILGLGASVIPFPNHNQSSRVMQQAQKHGKQAIGFYCSNFKSRSDTSSHILFYPQKQLVRTRASALLEKTEFTNGQNAIVAIACYSGYNQEDSIIMNQSSIDRGLFRTMHFHTYHFDIPSNADEEFRKPSASDVGGTKYQGSNDKLDPEGFPYIGASLSSPDIIAGKVTSVPGSSRLSDRSVRLKHTEKGHVDRVVLSMDEDGKKHAKVRLRESRMPQTLGQMLESLLGKAVANGCCQNDATPFSSISVESLTDLLHRSGYGRWGMECMCNGRTGGMFKAKIFMGPTFYQRLIHMAQDKLKWRRTGPVHPLTRQPVADRKRHGGVKFGEMERDCMVAHGAAATLQERLFYLSDYYFVHVCNDCHMMASTDSTRVPHCRFCRSKKNIVRVNIPYACKLLIQELFSMGIALRLFCEPC
ncbi:hypothetical protein O6H91_Y025100 [Diphasiastrum complanatum]|nr:hypothetical protein O6H91_Y025100 [Diphasiastrum complanatum]